MKKNRGNASIGRGGHGRRLKARTERARRICKMRGVTQAQITADFGGPARRPRLIGFARLPPQSVHESFKHHAEILEPGRDNQ